MSNQPTYIAVSEPSNATAFAVQVTECPSCAKNTATINTMLAVMQQQAATLKDQQSTIANLITMLSSSSHNSGTELIYSPVPQAFSTSIRSRKSEAEGAHPVSSSKIIPMVFESEEPVKRGRGRPRLDRHTPTSSSATKKRAREEEHVPSPPPAIEAWVDEGEPVVKNEHGTVEHDEGQGNEEGNPITRIWIRGSAQDRCPCPLPECTSRQFAAADMYYLRRHFQQVHRITHPNPIFIIQCPVASCAEEFEGSLRDLRKHIAKDHPQLLPAKPASVQKRHSKQGNAPPSMASPTKNGSYLQDEDPSEDRDAVNAIDDEQDANIE